MLSNSIGFYKLANPLSNQGANIWQYRIQLAVFGEILCHPCPRSTELYETYLFYRVLAQINQVSRILPVLNESNYLGIGLSYDTFSIDFYNSVTFKEERGGGMTTY